MKRRRVQVPEEGAPAWMNTYGDMVTLMLTFFVLLFAFSTLNAKKWQQIVQSFSGSISIQNGGGGVIGEGGVAPQPSAGEGVPGEVVKQFDKLYDQIKSHISDKGLQDSLEVVSDGKVITLRMKDSALFNSGKAAIRKDSVKMLEDIIAILHEYKDSISRLRIEGHTDDRPISNAAFRSNWDLSVARAVSVLKYVLGELDIPPDKLSAAGYGEYHPIDTNQTPEGRSRNRRVDFIIEGS